MNRSLYFLLILITPFNILSPAVFGEDLSPGGIAAIYKEGKVISKRVNGYSDLKRKIQISDHTRFYFGSDGKKFTSFCIAQLALRGRLDLKDKVLKYIPELPAYMQDVTIDHLLYHTSGIRDYLSVINIMCRPKDESLFRNEKILGLIQKQSGLNFKPGTLFCYSNSNYFLLALIVERVTGESFFQYVRRSIIGPAGMNQTRFRFEKRNSTDAYGYSSGKSGFKKDETDNAEHKGDGGIVSTVADMDKFYTFLFSPENAAVLKIMQEPAMLNGKPFYYRRGLMTDSIHGERIWFHGGGFKGFTSQMIYIPSRKISIVTAVNFSGIDALKVAQQLADSILRTTPPACLVNNHDPVSASLSGWYLDSLAADFRSFQVVEGQLFTSGSIKLDHRKGNIYISSCIPYIEYEFDTAKGIVERRTSTFSGRMKKVNACTFDKNHAGTYICKEANETKAEVEIEKGSPVFYYNRRYLARVSVAFEESCILQSFDAVIRFGRNEKGEEGFWMSNDRVFNLWFRKKS